MPLSAQDFLKINYASDIKHIANKLDIEYDDGILKEDLIDLIITNYFPDDELTKRKLKKILDMLYKYDLVRICKKLDGSGYSRYNFEELRDYIVDLCFNFEYAEESSDDIGGWLIEDFLELFTKENLTQIANYHEIDYNSRFNKNDFIKVISDELFSNHYLDESNLILILDAFYKYELKRIFNDIIPFSFSGLTAPELQDLVIEFFTGTNGEYEDYDDYEEEEEDYIEPSRRAQRIDEIIILIAGAQPVDQDDIELQRELMKMEGVLEDMAIFKLVSRPRNTFDKFNRNLRFFKPHILHLTAHGDKGKIIFEDDFSRSDPRRIELLANIIKRHNKDRTEDPLRGFILSSCYSEQDAIKLTESVHFVIAMSDAIKVVSAMQFLEGFYSEIKLGGSIQDAFENGIDYIDDKTQRKIPKLLPKNRDFSEMRLVIY